VDENDDVHLTTFCRKKTKCLGVGGGGEAEPFVRFNIQAFIFQG
jgi:hypothetical protein